MISNFRGKLWGGEGITYKISVKSDSEEATILFKLIHSKKLQEMYVRVVQY